MNTLEIGYRIQTYSLCLYSTVTTYNVFYVCLYASMAEWKGVGHLVLAKDLDNDEAMEAGGHDS